MLFGAKLQLIARHQTTLANILITWPQQRCAFRIVPFLDVRNIRNAKLTQNAANFIAVIETHHAPIT